METEEIGYCKTMGHWNMHCKGPECKEWQNEPHTANAVTRFGTDQLLSTSGQLWGGRAVTGKGAVT